MEVYFFHEDLEKFISSLEELTIAKAVRVIMLLERFGSNLGMPQSKALAGGIFELRIRGIQEVRIFYAFHKRTAVLLYGYIKKTEKTPVREIRTAMKRKTLLDAR